MECGMAVSAPQQSKLRREVSQLQLTAQDRAQVVLLQTWRGVPLPARRRLHPSSSSEPPLRDKEPEGPGHLISLRGLRGLR